MDNDNITAVELARVDIYVYDAKTTAIAVYKSEQKIGDAVDQGNGFWRYQFAPGQLTQGENVITALACGLGGFSDPSNALIRE